MYTLERTPYSPKAREIAYDLIPKLRDNVELPGSDVLQGIRFKDDDSVFIRLESMTKEGEFMTRPRACVTAALIEAARSDYWYEKEKDYEMELPTDGMDEDDD